MLQSNSIWKISLSTKQGKQAAITHLDSSPSAPSLSCYKRQRPVGIPLDMLDSIFHPMPGWEKEKAGSFVQALFPNYTLDLNKENTAHMIRNNWGVNEKQQSGGFNHIISSRVRRKWTDGSVNYLQWHETLKEIQNQRRWVKKLSLVSMLIQNCLFGGLKEGRSNDNSSRETAH